MYANLSMSDRATTRSTWRMIVRSAFHQVACDRVAERSTWRECSSSFIRWIAIDRFACRQTLTPFSPIKRYLLNAFWFLFLFPSWTFHRGKITFEWNSILLLFRNVSHMLAHSQIINLPLSCEIRYIDWHELLMMNKVRVINYWFHIRDYLGEIRK